jgi:hypothetical protein
MEITVDEAKLRSEVIISRVVFLVISPAMLFHAGLHYMPSLRPLFFEFFVVRKSRKLQKKFRRFLYLVVLGFTLPIKPVCVQQVTLTTL